MQTIDVEQMRDKLLTMDQVRSRLSVTESLTELEFSTDGGDNVSFDLPDDWNANLKDMDDLDTTGVTFRIGTHVERQLTKEAVLNAASEVGVPQALMASTPGHLTADMLNWHYNNGKKDLKLLGSLTTGLAFTRATIEPYSNTAILDAALAGIQETYGSDDVLADYKFHHDLNQTVIRLVVPHRTRLIGSARAESAVNDPWSAGLEIRNSVTGAKPLEISGYLFAWWCTNGATSTHASSGKYRRKPTVDATEAYDWARDVVEEVLGGLEHELDAVESLTQVPLEGDMLGETIGTLFDRFGVPSRTREDVIRNLVDSDDLTAYGLMNAITAVANDSEASQGTISALLRAGGMVSHTMGNPCPECHRY